ncbi:End3p NDAI_0B03960 [Naumovozyma dairenensis CBS 421]|uniref:Actin cytoskeleton-regulatory complex protein END3 n=1 Tax=Naumovozyma dairenensis (strain ATCC 10597 / BCRC 20456 / CBS 421 / NBRC 0211 / NRRL Y-12639) TaxID=1071378 RepID=G0W6L9_NAUDC|nr:hypothetical protein NDAI_0B03960 [Naumovozyma dairenensis CBS 421]CCD23430.1 hypothetical protein NDAI_0B03960 [Naumovozyma dairenensis CBS 421]
MPKLEQFEIKKYWQIFSGLKPVENKVTHDQVLPILYNSKLDSSILNKIWFLADIDDDDNLDFEEFVICMRLIFDMVNKNIEKVPDELPEWLIPGSKAKLVKERMKMKQQENADIPKKEPPKMDWYMSPEDKTLYEDLWNSCTKFTDGTATFPALTIVLKSKFFNIGTSDFSKIWELINPKNLASIDKDPALLFIHCLRQRNDVNAAIPKELPPALANICNKQTIKYDLDSNQPNLTRPTTTAPITTNTDNESPSTSDAEIKRLENKLKELDTKSEAKRNQPVASSTSSIDPERLNVVREQFEGLLDYLRQQTLNNASNAQPPSADIRVITEDLDSIEQQVKVLENYLTKKKDELQSLKQEIQSHSN